MSRIHSIPLKLRLFASWGLLFSLALPSHADSGQVIDDTKPIIKQFAESLKSELQQAMKTGGPVAAINACNTQAPVITHKSGQAGWEVARTSLQWRNPDNQPDVWERKQLNRFQTQLTEGANPDTLWAVEETETHIRVMKAIPTQAICLTCHGDAATLNPDVKDTLSQLYPNDKATGYKLGELRGAFTLIKMKDEPH